MKTLVGIFKGASSSFDVRSREIGCRVEALVFIGVFFLVFSSIKLQSVAFADGNVEQWVNLTNSMFQSKRDFLFSYGPLYWLAGGAVTQYSVYSYWVAAATLSAVAALFWSLLVPLLRQLTALILFGVAYFFLYNYLVHTAYFFLLPFAIVARLEFSKGMGYKLNGRLAMVLGFMVGVFIYIRFFYGLVGLAALGSYMLVSFIYTRSLRSILLFVGTFVLTYCVVGLGIFHSYASIIEYLVINQNLSFGNSVDMTLDIRNSTKTFIFCGVFAVVTNLYLVLKRPRLILTANMMLLLLFKLGFSRTDHYIPYFVLPAAVIAIPMLFEKSVWPKVTYVMAVFLMTYISSHAAFPGAAIKSPLALSTNFDISYTQRMQDLYRSYSLDTKILSEIGDSTVDVYPYNNEYVFANKLNYKFRPSFQNYMTLTPALDRLNSKYLASGEGPEYILWTAGVACVSNDCKVFDGIDYKYALNEDPLTSGSILLNYHPVVFSTGKNHIPLVLMKRNEELVEPTNVITQSGRLSFNQWYKVPTDSDGVTKLVPHFEFTLVGKIKNLLFRGGIVKIKYKLQSGEISEYRINIINSSSGIWIDPLLTKIDFSGDGVDSIMLVNDEAWYIQPEFAADWVKVAIPKISRTLPAYSEVFKPQQGAKALETACEGFVDRVNGIAPEQASSPDTRAVKVIGWLAKSTQNAILYDHVFVTLTDKAGNRLLFTTSPELRPDVGNAFNNKVLANAGYKALIDTSKVRGAYTLGLAGLSGDTLSVCTQYQYPMTFALDE